MPNVRITLKAHPVHPPKTTDPSPTPISTVPTTDPTTPSTDTTTPTSISIPTTLSGFVGNQLQLTATVENTLGAVLTGTQPDAWHSSNTGVATVSQTGLVIFVAEGTTQITATITTPSLTSNVCAVTSQPVAAGGPGILASFPEIPSTATVLTSQPWNADGVPTVGHSWVLGIDNTFSFTGYTDADLGPVSGSGGMYRLLTPAGQAGGGVGTATSNSNRYYLAADGVEGHSTLHEVYVGTVFKIASPYSAPDSLGQKIGLISELCFFTFSGDMWLEWESHETDFTTGHVIVANECDVHNTFKYEPNIAHTEMHLDEWHRATMYMKSSSTSETGDGIVRVWVDGVLNIELTNIFTRGADRSSLSEWNQNWEWGGGGVTPFQLDRRTDHTLIAVP